jgi:hypothetical protein
MATATCAEIWKNFSINRVKFRKPKLYSRRGPKKFKELKNDLYLFDKFLLRLLFKQCKQWLKKSKVPRRRCIIELKHIKVR